MDLHSQDSLVTGHETLIASLAIPDPDDRHVLAAAIVAGADVTVTRDLRDSPAESLAPCGIEAQRPDMFVRHPPDLAPLQLVDAWVASADQHGMMRPCQYRSV